MTQNKLIAFCYLFMTGIALAMFFPLSGTAVNPLWIFTAVLGLLTIGGLMMVRRLRPPVVDDSPYAAPVQMDSLQVSLWVILLVTGLLFGYTRYLTMVQPPDRVVGELQIQGATSSFTAESAMSGTSFLKIKTLEPVSDEIRLRLVGRLEALRPVLDDQQIPVLDGDGRWNFSQSNIPQETDPIVIPAGTPAGTEVLIQKPFTHLDSVEMLNEPASGRIAVLQPVNSVALFARSGRNVVPVSILGRISADPWVYSFKTILAITPDYIQYQPDGPYFAVDRQITRVTVKPDMPGYDQLARSAAFGFDIFLTGGLITPPSAANAGAFDQARYLRSHNVGGQMMLRTPRDGAPPISIVIPQGFDAPREGNGLVEFALYLRDEMVRVIKQTMPQPNSNFLGALTLGLRYGMQDTVSLASDDYDDAIVPPLVELNKPTQVLIADEFRASGVSHVLAVSGLHVTIIMLMFMGIFTLLKISKKVFVPFIIFALIIFAIITGARPSTLRAVIMNSLFLLTWGYLGQGLRASALLGLPVAGFLILIQNPSMLTDPSFTLSFGAILSLVLVTQPFFDIFKKFRGNDFIGLVLMVSLLTYVFATHWLLVVTIRFWVAYFLIGVGVFSLTRFLTARGFNPIRNYGFADIPPVAGGFIAAQFGLQIGMMIPLSAFYFYRWPVAGAYANLLAIPLVGVVLQLSMLAGLIGLIPGVGIYLALVMNAANWIFSSLFLLIGHYFSVWFVYPFVTKPTLRWLFVYYALVGVFVWWRPLWFRIVRPRWQRASTSLRFIAVGIVVLLTASLMLADHNEKKALRPEGQLAISVLSVGYGSAILVDTPDNKAILIDTAFVQTSHGSRNNAIRTVLPFVNAKQIKQLDGLILTSRAPEHTAGAASVLKHVDVAEVLYPASVKSVVQRGDLADLMEARSGDSIKHRLSGTTVTPHELVAGDRLFESDVDGKAFYIEVLAPAGGDTRSPLSLRLVYGDFAMFLPSDLTFAQQKALLKDLPADKLQANVAVAPGHGTAGLENIRAGLPDDMDQQLIDATGALLQAVNPEAVIYEFGNPRPVTQMKYRLAVKLHGASRRTAEDMLPNANHYATDTDGAVTILSDGETYTLDTQYSGATGEADAPTSLEIGW
jgi:ComEC/Rec2-related protein